MKVATLIVVSCCFAAPAFADAERCTNNLRQLETETANPAAQQSATETDLFIEQARAAQAKGDTDGCVAASERALKAMDQSYRQGNGAGAGSGGGTGGAGGGGTGGGSGN